MTSSNSFNYKECLNMLLEHHPKHKAIIKKAFYFAKEKHKGQVRNSGEIYFSHPVAVALKLNELHADYQTICAALLHDTIEDCGVTYKELCQEFGEPIKVGDKEEIDVTIAKLVEGCTAVENLKSKDDETEEEKEIRHNKTINKIIMSIEDDPRVALIKLIDRLHNMETINGFRDDNKEERKKKGQKSEEALLIYASIAKILGLYDIKEQLEERAFKVLYPDIVKNIQEFKNNRYNNDDFLSLISPLDSDNSIPSKIKKRLIQVSKELFKQEITEDDFKISVKIKGNYGIHNRKEKKDLNDFSQVHDLIKFKITAKNEQLAYFAYCVVSGMFPIMNTKGYELRDYISDPKHPFYRCIKAYYSLETDENSYIAQFEFNDEKQNIRTALGIASYWNYDDYGDNNIKDIMKSSIRTEFPFYKHLTQLCSLYKQGRIDDADFKDRLIKIIFADMIIVTVDYSRDNILGGNIKPYQYYPTYEGSKIADIIIDLNGGFIDNNARYFVNDEEVSVSYVLKNNDVFREESRVVRTRTNQKGEE